LKHHDLFQLFTEKCSPNILHCTQREQKQKSFEKKADKNTTKTLKEKNDVIVTVVVPVV
jgi:hypothetical protein